MHLGKCQGLIKQKKSMVDSYMRKNDKKQTEPTFLKIIYFDEAAAQDYLDITNGEDWTGVKKIIENEWRKY